MAWLIVASSLYPARAAVAQQPLAPRVPSVRAPDRGAVVEARLELIAAGGSTVQGGGAALWPVSPYLSLGALAAAGVTRGREASAGDLAARASRPSGRGELLARFTPDPWSDARWRPYGQASVGVLAVHGGGRGRALVAAAVGVERVPRGATGLRPALEVGVGGGLRVALALRTSIPRPDRR